MPDLYAEGYRRWATYTKHEAYKAKKDFERDGKKVRITRRANLGTGNPEYIVWIKE